MAALALITLITLALTWPLTAVLALAIAIWTAVARKPAPWGRLTSAFALATASAFGYALEADDSFFKLDSDDPCPWEPGDVAAVCDGPPGWIFPVIAVCALLFLLCACAWIVHRWTVHKRTRSP
ncbi:hypothetical protein [Nonomuraea africana]|uniref:Integral membrane protein n=1 Tax=Nonomuraea africana TaxID=46171 RepID=A0ABR9KB08_9ACTN|nr:hypothetical protein [Nonomuraea africana]MBE1559201.1 hypothetical protein [Nonomuraea africana]